MDVSHTTSSLSSMYVSIFWCKLTWDECSECEDCDVILGTANNRKVPRPLSSLWKKNWRKKNPLLHNLSRNSRWKTVFALAEFPFLGNFYQFSIFLYQNTIIMDLWNWNIKLYVCRSSCILVHHIASM